MTNQLITAEEAVQRTATSRGCISQAEAARFKAEEQEKQREEKKFIARIEEAETKCQEEIIKATNEGKDSAYVWGAVESGVVHTLGPKPLFSELDKRLLDVLVGNLRVLGYKVSVKTHTRRNWGVYTSSAQPHVDWLSANLQISWAEK